MEQKTVLVKTAINAWQLQIDRFGKFISELSDEQLMKEFAPGRNRGIYLIGHLVAYHDLMPEILGLGQRMHPELPPLFLQTPDKSVEQIPSLAALRALWTEVHERLQKSFEDMPAENWFSRHESMTDADFEKDPLRNKLSVLLNRTAHISYHFGQIRLLK